MRAISSKLGVPQDPVGPQPPSGPQGWLNAYDERDIVALNPLDATWFPTSPSIVNDNGVDNQSDNRHGIVGYLNDGDVAAQIAAAL